MKRELRKALRDSRTYKQSEDDLISTIEDLYADEIGSLKSKIKELEGRLPTLNEQYGDEIWAAYPDYLSKEINGTRAIAKSTNDRKGLLEQYVNDIKNDPTRHAKVISDIKWAVENKFIEVGIEKFIRNQDYLRIERLRLQSQNKQQLIYGEREL